MLANLINLSIFQSIINIKKKKTFERNIKEKINFSSLIDAAHFVPPYVALTKSEDIVFKREPVVKDEDDEEEGDKHAIATQETETKPMYLPQGL